MTVIAITTDAIRRLGEDRKAMDVPMVASADGGSRRMTPERWRQVEELFHQALEKPEADRIAWIREASAGDEELAVELLSLLASDDAGGGNVVGSHIQQAVRALGCEPALENRRIGPYRLVRELGRGGMGAVYLAARADEQYESQVAIKLVRPGLDTEFILRRFRRERQILARLEHPHIARLLDGGTTSDGTPYIVMEFVEGASWITTYAAAKHLSIEDKLRLFLPVCAAVAHAHRYFVVHRDLKPGNILIDAGGTPKLLDFGISKLLHTGVLDTSETHDVQLMTPDYASPEQIVGDAVTVASDIYSLGAVLYELLTGKRPHQIENCRPAELERVICHSDTVAPSVAVRPQRTLERRLSGDLDTIVLHAMQKSPERRYATVEQFADDIRRHLEHRPVLARRDSLWYRCGKFLRRNRVPASLTGIAATILIAGTAVSMEQARIAGRRYEQVRKLASTFVFDVEAAARDLPGSMKVRQLIVGTGLEYLNSLAGSSARDWDLKRELAAAYQKIGDVQGGTDTANLGDPAAALASYRRAEGLLDEVLKHDPSNRKALLDWLNLVAIIGDVQVASGQEPLSVNTYNRGMQRVDAALAGREDVDLEHASAVFLFDLARALRQTGDLEGSNERVSRGIGLARKVVAARPEDRQFRLTLTMGYAQLGGALADYGRLKEALEYYSQGVVELEELCRRFPLDTHARHELMLAYSHVGDTLGNPGFINLGDPAGALSAYKKMTEAAKMLFDADPADTRAVMDYGIAQLRLGLATPERAEKLRALRRSEQLLTLSVQQNPRHTMAGVHKGWAEEELGDLLKDQDRAGAIRQYQNAVGSSYAVLAIEPNSRAAQRRLTSALSKLAEEQARAGQQSQAEATAEKLVQFGENVRTNSPGALTYRLVSARALHLAGDAYQVIAAQGASQDRARARECYRRSFEAFQAVESQPGFLPAYRKEMETIAAALGKLERGKR